MKLGRALANPCDESAKSGMGAQGLDAAIAARQFRLGQGRVNFIVANLVQ